MIFSAAAAAMRGRRGRRAAPQKPPETLVRRACAARCEPQRCCAGIVASAAALQLQAASQQPAAAAAAPRRAPSRRKKSWQRRGGWWRPRYQFWLCWRSSWQCCAAMSRAQASGEWAAGAHCTLVAAGEGYDRPDTMVGGALTGRALMWCAPEPRENAVPPHEKAVSCSSTQPPARRV